MTRFVLDNSVTMRWLFGDGAPDDLAYAAGVLRKMETDGAEALVPVLWGLEAGNVMARAEAKGWLLESRSAEFLGILQRMAIRVDDATSVHALGNTLQLARRHNLSTYDASYLELALREGLPLATLDGGLRAAVQRVGARLF